jgi:tRNA pseudouridine65 synthase
MTEQRLEVLYRDEHYVAVSKPAGVMVHRSRLERRDRRFVLQMMRDQLGLWVYPVHRLDKPTAGVLLFSFSDDGARRMAEAFAGGRVAKTYLAVVRGHAEKAAEIDYPLARDPRSRREGQLLRSAVTRCRRLAVAELPHAVGRYATARYSLLAVSPVTGRMHQIRRHLHHIHHPVLGDKRYGDNHHNRFFRDHLGCDRLLLAAVELRFTHPFSGAETVIADRLNDAFARIVRRLDWTAAVPGKWLNAADEPLPPVGHSGVEQTSDRW